MMDINKNCNKYLLLLFLFVNKNFKYTRETVNFILVCITINQEQILQFLI